MIRDLGVKCVEVDRGSGGGMRWLLKDPQGRRQTKHLIAARPGWARTRGACVGMQRGAIFSVVLVVSGNGGNNRCEVKRQQDKRWMTNSPGWVQNRGRTRQRAVKRRLAVQSYGWKGGRFWRQRLSFSASFSQVPIFYM